jgi:dolichyl-phosphate beta-glucosyltransferase
VSAPDTAIVIPCYNEAGRLPSSVLANYARRSNHVRLLCVDDGSTDSTRAVLERLRAEAAENVEVLALESNMGKGEAVREGVEAALRSDVQYVGYWDADVSTPLEDIEVFRDILHRRPELIAVMGSRVRRLGADIHRRADRHYLGRVFATLVSIVLRVPVYDSQCGAKLFRVNDELRRAFAEPFLSKWIFDVEVIARLIVERRASHPGQPVQCFYEHPLSRWHDVPGSKLALSDMTRAVGDLWRIRRAYRAADAHHGA